MRIVEHEAKPFVVDADGRVRSAEEMPRAPLIVGVTAREIRAKGAEAIRVQVRILKRLDDGSP